MLSQTSLGHLDNYEQVFFVHDTPKWLQECQERVCPPSHLDGSVSDKVEYWCSHTFFWVFLMNINKFCLVHDTPKWLQACQEGVCPPSHLDGSVSDRVEYWCCHKYFWVFWMTGMQCTVLQCVYRFVRKSKFKLKALYFTIYSLFIILSLLRSIVIVNYNGIPSPDYKFSI